MDEDFGRQPLRHELPAMSSRPHQIAPEDLLRKAHLDARLAGKGAQPPSMLRRKNTVALPVRAHTVKFDFTEEDQVNLDKMSQNSSCFDSHDTLPQT